MSWAEWAWQRGLHGLFRGKRGIQAGVPPLKGLILLTDLVWQEDSFWLSVRADGDRLHRGAHTTEPRKYGRKPLSYLRQWMHLDHRWISPDL